MAESSSGQDARKETSQADEYFVQGNYPPGFVVPPRYFTQHLYYPYVNPYSHLTESNGNLSIHGYGSDGRPKFRRSRTIFSPEQLDILEEHFGKYKYPDVKRRRAIAEEVGLPEERVQVWFQNRRAKNKRQADQQVKLQKLVNEAISSNASSEQQHLQNIQGSSDLDVTVSDQNAQEYLRSALHRLNPHDKETEEGDSTFHGTEAKIPRLKEPEMVNQKDSIDSLPNSCVDKEIAFREHRDDASLSKRAGNPASSQNTWTQSSNSAFETPEAQVVIQNIDQDLLFKVANILSASNDATSLISEWSQMPDKAYTNNLEEQLRHFAEHHHQVLSASQSGPTNTMSSSNHTSQKKTGNRKAISNMAPVMSSHHTNKDS